MNTLTEDQIKLETALGRPVDISVVLAVYNEEACVRKELEIIEKTLEASNLSYEIIVIDDASTDKTPEILKELQGRPGIQVVRHAFQKGSGGARKTGTKLARGQYVAWTDADMTYPNHRIPELLGTLKMSKLDQVVGARESEKGTYKPIRFFAKWFIRRLAIYLSGQSIPDLNSGLRIFRRDLAEKYLYLVPDGFSCVTSITLAFLCNGHSVGYVPIEYHKRVGRSKFHPFHDTYRYVLQVARMITYFNPLKVFLTLSLSLFALGFASSLRHIFSKGGLEQMDVVILLVSVLIGCLGLLADLIVVQGKR